MPEHEMENVATHAEGPPAYRLDSELDASAFRGVLNHALDNQVRRIDIAKDRPIRGDLGEAVFDLSARSIFAFEIDELMRAFLPRDEYRLAIDAGRLETSGQFERTGGGMAAYDLAVEREADGSLRLRVDIRGEIAVPRDEAAPSPEGDFAGTHDGSMFLFQGQLDKDSFDSLLKWAGNRKASDVTITPNQPVLADIGGALCKITDRVITPDEIAGVVRHVYGEDGPAQVNGGHDLDPSYEVRVSGERLRRYRINVTGGRVQGGGGGSGMQMTIRTLPSSPIPIAKLNVESDLLAATRPQNGIIFVCGPTGSGKSTLMSSIIRMIVERPDANEKILEYSSPIEYVFDDVEMPSSTIFQTHVGKQLKPREAGRGSVWAYAARNSLRRKPTMIMLGEARDAETIEEAINISQEGHLVYTTMHTNSVAETINRAINVFPHESRDRISIDLMSSIRMIVTQILVPKIGGGRAACREFMVFDPKVRDRFFRTPSKNWPILIQRTLQQKEATGQTMIAAALKLLKQGQISRETFEKVAEAGGKN